MREQPSITCPGCGALVPDIDAPTHAYIGAAPGCWRVYGKILAREYGELGNPPWHRLTVDAYAAQHPGTDSRRARQSVAGHLIAMCLVFEHEFDLAYVTRLMPRAVGIAADAPWLDPPDFAGAPTVLGVAEAQSPNDHERAVRAWARGVWLAWSPHHAAVRGWASTLL